MAINVFEGARRIAKLLAALWVVGWVVAAFNVSPTISATYKILYPGAMLLRMTGECPPDGTTELLFDKVTQRGTKTLLTLCFPAQTASNGDRLIPYFVDPADGGVWLLEKYSPEVVEYIQRVAETFVFPQAEEKWIDGQWWPLFLKDIGWGAIGAVSGLLLLLAFTSTTGWIVRGFMDIPRGQDHKETNGEMK